MLKILKRFILSAVVIMTISSPLQAAERFTFDDQHSYVLWQIKHMGFSTQSGKWYFSGFVILDKEKPQNSKVEAKIDIGNLVTGIPELDKHLKTEAFLDVKNYPIATFVSNKVEVTGKNSAMVHGTLTLHGISKPVTLKVTLNKAGKNPINDRITAGFSASTDIKRSDFGIKTFLPDLGDEVHIEIGAEAFQPKA